MLHSSVDPVLYTRTVWVDDPELPADVLRTLDNALDQSRALGAWRALEPSSSVDLFEEAFRYWLGLRMPYLYRHAATALAQELATFRRLSAQGAWRSWRADLPLLHALDAEWRIIRAADGGITAVEAPDALHDGVLLGRVSVSALVDTAVALASFRVHSRSSLWTDRGAFRRWAVARPTTAATVDLVVSVLHDGELAMRALAPLIAESLSTTRPVAAFAHFLGELAHIAGSADFEMWRQQPEPARWGELFGRLTRTLGQAARADADGPCAPLALPAMLEDLPEHPFLTPYAREWAGRAELEAAYGWFVHQAPWAPRRVAEAIWRDFQPPASVYRFHVGDDVRVFFALDPELAGVASTPTSLDDARTLLMTHGVVQRAAAGAHAGPRLCHHAGCPEYEAGYCGTYVTIPREYLSCAFPDRMSQLTGGGEALTSSGAITSSR